ncbi:peptidase inhibitor family I36 protein [Kitasatospora camelliae]|uniref:Peptidase inhibitor family I36 protein n=1 Tax=Kitasatospora camelliae TaxID=3156397 RepID=A0AAU8K386_9ACTN
MLAHCRRLLSRTATALLPLAAACALALVAAVPAGAADLDGTTDNGEFSLYGGPDTTSEVLDMYWARGDLSQLQWPRWGGNPNDQNESYWNNDSLTWHVYTDAYRGGQHGWISPGVISNASSTFWHRISSAYYTA